MKIFGWSELTKENLKKAILSRKNKLYDGDKVLLSVNSLDDLNVLDARFYLANKNKLFTVKTITDSLEFVELKEIPNKRFFKGDLKRPGDWNIAFHYFIEIKREYEKKFGKIKSYSPERRKYETENGTVTKNLTSLAQWVEDLGIEEYQRMIKPLMLTQKGEFLLMRYGVEEEVPPSKDAEISEDTRTPWEKAEEFWSAWNGFYRECRSVVINMEKEELVITPFKKFFNLEQLEENSMANIMKEVAEASAIEITNKWDGSMHCARWYNEDIFYSTTKALEEECSWRLDDGKQMLLKQQNYIDMLRALPTYTFIFEYIALKDAHIVQYQKEQEGLYLIGIREVVTGKQLTYKEVEIIGKQFGVKTVGVLKETLPSIMNQTETFKSNEKEGWVLNIIDRNGEIKLVKIKCSDYRNVHRLLNKLASINSIIKAIADNTFEELVAQVPESYTSRVIKIASPIFNYVTDMTKETNKYYSKIPSGDKKEVMIWIEANVPSKLKSYVKSKYLGQEYNFLKSNLHSRCPKYIKATEMGLESQINAIFAMEDF